MGIREVQDGVQNQPKMAAVQSKQISRQALERENTKVATATRNKTKINSKAHKNLDDEPYADLAGHTTIITKKLLNVFFFKEKIN